MLFYYLVKHQLIYTSFETTFILFELIICLL
jgi:hypothetical protein